MAQTIHETTSQLIEQINKESKVFVCLPEGPFVDGHRPPVSALRQLAEYMSDHANDLEVVITFKEGPTDPRLYPNAESTYEKWYHFALSMKAQGELLQGGCLPLLRHYLSGSPLEDFSYSLFVDTWRTEYSYEALNTFARGDYQRTAPSLPAYLAEEKVNEDAQRAYGDLSNYLGPLMAKGLSLKVFDESQGVPGIGEIESKLTAAMYHQ
jgi:hypothetical protein